MSHSASELGSESHPIVRRATSADVTEIGRLGALLVEVHYNFDPSRFLVPSPRTANEYASFIRTQLEEPDKIVLVADNHSDVVGYAYGALEGYDFLALRGPAGILHDLIVDPEFRGRGVGRLLVVAMLDFFRSRGVPRVVLSTAEQTATAQQLFTRMGFRRTMIEMTHDLNNQTTVRDETL